MEKYHIEYCRNSWLLSLFFILLLSCFSGRALAQEGQTVQGQIVDSDSGYPIIGANIILADHEPLLGTTTDADGRFQLKNVPLGRQSLKVSAMGYAPQFLRSILVVGGRSTQLNIELTEQATQLEELVIQGQKTDARPNNEMALVSGRGFDTELTERFAGSRNDPARMATNFAGVSGANDGRNDIIIRGNSPMGVLWRLEDIDIPSPNHFASFGSTGGPVGMLNTNALGRSDFMTSAFPASYGNALSGAFDLTMRNGKVGRPMFTGQIGFNGIELGAEGSFSKNSNATYLINYRYSTLDLFKKIGLNFGTGSAVPQYQDLSMKLNFPLKNAGKLSVFALGGKSSIDILGSDLDLESDDTDLYGNENVDIYNTSQTLVTGLSHTYFFDAQTYGKLTLAYTHQQNGVQVDTLTWQQNVPSARQEIFSHNREDRLVAHYFINRKWNSKHTTRSGVMLTNFINDFADSTYINYADTWHTYRSGDGNTQLVQAYTDWLYRFAPKWQLKSGVYGSYYFLNDQFAIEPRINLSYQWTDRLSVNAGFGMHSQTQPIPVLYAKPEFDGTDTSLQDNLNLGMSRSIHYVLGMNYQLAEYWSIKSEIYYQDLYDIPVAAQPSGFSMLNAGDDFALPYKFGLVNEGVGRNYGMELTVERQFADQFYALLTGSVFGSKYQGSDGIWRNTAFNSEVVTNALVGKEWALGSNLTLTADTKVVVAGGRYFTPIDLEESRKEGREVRREDDPYSEKMDPYFRWDFKIGLRLNQKKLTHEWVIDIQNLTNRQNGYSINYNSRTEQITQVSQLGLFVVPQYRIYF
ncbi:TonB-dependent receptor [Persicobacter psychrovividus]|uniref:Prevent-host-death protein n=1 Tax=Persicobacter psychrovividus TaxID=387638 RepID=A0ABM7VA49_9BACT|nr:prevent-host-death protein [Persicobacter psychrovividus]